MTRKIPLTVGLGNLSGEDFASLLSEDHAVVSALFETTSIAVDRQIPATRILFVYTRFAANGALEGAPTVGVRQVAQASGSRILVVASPTPEDIIQNVMSFPGPKTANLVFTLDRKGTAFGGFFTALFLKECATARTCFRRGSSLRRRRRWKRTTILSLYCSPRVAAIAIAPRSGQA